MSNNNIRLLRKALRSKFDATQITTGKINNSICYISIKPDTFIRGTYSSTVTTILENILKRSGIIYKIPDTGYTFHVRCCDVLTLAGYLRVM